MAVSDRGCSAIAGWEGVVLKPYFDVAGVLTQGCGHTNSAGAPKIKRGGPVWTREYALKVLRDDLARQYEPAVVNLLGSGGKPPSQQVLDGATSFHFNTGAIKRASWVKLLKKGDMSGARASFRSWSKARVKGQMVTLSGLLRRRDQEWAIIEKGVYPAGAKGSTIAMAAPVVVGGVPSQQDEPVRSIENGRQGRSDELVLAVQQNLRVLGYSPGPCDGIFGVDTKAAVIEFQRAHPDLTADGIVGPATWAQLKRAVALREKGKAASAVGVVSATSSAGAGSAGMVDPSLSIYVASGILGVAVLVLAYLLWRYWPEVQQAVNRYKGVGTE